MKQRNIGNIRVSEGSGPWLHPPRDEPSLPHGAEFVYGMIFAAVFWAVAGVAVWVMG